MSLRANSRLVRIIKELEDLRKDPPSNCSAGIISDSNYNLWEGTIIGPEGSPYAGGLFKLSINLPEEYPMKAPNVRFKTKVYHPNINREGSICLDLLMKNWSPANTLSSVLISICSLLTDPNPNDPLEKEAAQLYIKNRAQFDLTARQWTDKFAN